MKVQLQLRFESADNDKVMKDVLFIADHLSKMRVNLKVQEETLEKRKRLLRAAK